MVKDQNLPTQKSPEKPEGFSRTFSPLAMQLIKYIAGLYTLFIALVTGLQLIAEYQHERNNLILELSRLESTFNPPLSDALWDLDEESVHQTIYGMQKLDSVLGVRVDALATPAPVQAGMKAAKESAGSASGQNFAFHYHRGLVRDAGGHISFYSDNKKTTKKEDSRLFKSLDSVHFPIIHRLGDEYFLVGSGHIFTGMEVVINRISYGFFLIILASLAKTAILWLLFYLFMNKLVTRPLAALTSEARRLNPEIPDPPSREATALSPDLLQRRDELGALAKGMIAMGRGLNERNEKIARHSRVLEQRVADRTRDLAEKSRDLEAMLNHIRLGVLTITKTSQIHKEFSESVRGIFETEDPTLQSAGELIFSRSDLSPGAISRYHEVLNKIFLSQNPEAEKILGQLPAELHCTMSDGDKILELEWQILNDPEGNPEKIMLVAEDTTDFRKVQDELVQTKKIASLSHLVVGIAHELNTPAGIVMTSATASLDQTTKVLSNFENGTLKKTELREFLHTSRKHGEIIYKNIARASGLIKTFRQLGWQKTLESAQEFDITGYLHSYLKGRTDLFPDHDYCIEISENFPIRIVSYPDVFEQILTRLMANSVLHGEKSPHKTKIQIDLCVCDNSLVLDITDNGPGIDRKELDKIFDPFYTTSLGKGDSGLGLTIVHTLVTHALDGKISCASVKGQGTSFTITVPMNIASRAA